MDKTLFRVGDYVKVCTKCGEFSPAQNKRCDCGMELPMSMHKFTQDEFDRAQSDEISEPVQIDEEDLPLICNKCGKRYAFGSRCSVPGCGGSLMPDVSRDDVLRSVQMDEEFVSVSVNNQEYTYRREEIERISSPAYYTVTRYENNRPVATKKEKFDLKEGRLTIGRILFLQNPDYFFPEFNKQMALRYSMISRENADLIYEDGRVYIELSAPERRQDGSMKQKMAVRVNGSPLMQGERKLLQNNDEIILGQTEDVNGQIRLCIHQETLNKNTDIDMDALIAQVRRDVMQEVRNEMNILKTEAQQEIQNRFEQALEAISDADLNEREGENQDEYADRLVSIMPNLEDPDEECRRIFRFFKPDGTLVNCEEEFEAYMHDDSFREIIEDVAMLEELFDRRNRTNYSAVAGRLGLAFEQVVCTDVKDIIWTVNKALFEAELERNKERIKNRNEITQGFFLNFLLWDRGIERLWNVVDGAGYEHNPHELDLLRRSLTALNEYRSHCRNSGNHAPAAAYTGENDHSENQKKKFVSREDYYMYKEEVLKRHSLSNIRRYYMNIMDQDQEA